MTIEKAIIQGNKKKELFKSTVYVLKDNDGSFFSCLEMNFKIHLEKLTDKNIYHIFVHAPKG